MRTGRYILCAVILSIAQPAMARGGGGCLMRGTTVLTPDGPVAIERLGEGDYVIGVINGELKPAAVLACCETAAEDYYELRTQFGTVLATAEHPFMVAGGVFRTADRLRDGDTVYVLQNGSPSPARLLGVAHVRADAPAYNLMVSAGGTFIADGFIVHNKGCFLGDTPIIRADGTASFIRDIRPGDELLAFSADGQTTRAAVRNIISLQVDEYLAVATGTVCVEVTPDHPFYVGNGEFRTIESLAVGDYIYAYDGKGLSPQKIVSIRRIRAAATVYNLQTDRPHTFFANGLAVHNKGGGCFPAGVGISTPSGLVPIERIEPGQMIFTVDHAGRLGTSAVEEVFTTSDLLLIFETDCGELRTTAEHPVLIFGEGFLPAGQVKTGQELGIWRDGRLCRSTVRSIVAGREPVAVFNLRVGGPHTFIAAGFVVHNKGGCFPAGVGISTPSGLVPIERIEPGQLVITVDHAGRLGTSAVEEVFTTSDLLLILETDCGKLRTTTEHPVLVFGKGFLPAGQVKAGQELGVWRDGRLCRSTVRSIVAGREPVAVFNLRVGGPHTFIADGFVVHNKGGGFHGGGSHHSGGGGGGGSSESAAFLFVVVFGIIIVLIIISGLSSKAKSKSQQNLDYCYSRTAIRPKAEKTLRLLEFIAKQDESFNIETLAQTATGTFVKLQECWQSRVYMPMKELLMPDLYSQHCKQIQGLIRSHEIDVIDQLTVKHADIVNVRYTHKPDQREFTVLFTASARDYYIDDRTKKFIRGDRRPETFQEFWTFQLQDGRWLLREIEQTRESDVLKDENFFEQFTDMGRDQIYGDAAGKDGQTGPWLEKGTGLKATRIERMLNFLVQTDKRWDRQQMLQRARDVFMGVYAAREAADINVVNDEDLFPDVAQNLREEILTRVERGVAVEFRNLCIRKVELILVRNYTDNSKDEFTVRISAHAQRAMSRNGAEVSMDPHVVPFEEYWTFGNMDRKWKLKEVLPPAKGEKQLGEENLDEDSTPSQVQWYYRQTRAN